MHGSCVHTKPKPHTFTDNMSLALRCPYENRPGTTLQEAMYTFRFFTKLKVQTCIYIYLRAVYLCCFEKYAVLWQKPQAK
jgi:hypothetical protein